MRRLTLCATKNICKNTFELIVKDFYDENKIKKKTDSLKFIIVPPDGLISYGR
jgi:hypothetical protein